VFHNYTKQLVLFVLQVLIFHEKCQGLSERPDSGYMKLHPQLNDWLTKHQHMPEV